MTKIANHSPENLRLTLISLNISPEATEMAEKTAAKRNDTIVLMLLRPRCCVDNTTAANTTHDARRTALYSLLSTLTSPLSRGLIEGYHHHEHVRAFFTN
jgi:hypothetical protein